MLVLGIESSCDETGVALVQARASGMPELLGHALYSQVEMHQAFGGVVPELASRDHIRRVLPLAEVVLRDAVCRLADVDVVALRGWLEKARAIQWDYKNLVRRKGRLEPLTPAAG